MGKANPKELVKYLERPEMRATLAKVLPASIMAPERFGRLALSALRTSDTLQRCDMMSVLACCVEAASMGLELNTPAGLAYMVPYKGKATLVIGYRGLCALAYRSGMVKSITAHVRYENDQFEIEYGTDERLLHVPTIDGDRGQALGAYAVIKTTTGGVVQRYLSESEILSARPAYWEKTPWNDKNPNVVAEMWLKTVVRRVAKLSPVSTEIQRAVALDDAASRGATLTLRDGDIEIIEAESEVVQAAPENMPGAKMRAAKAKAEAEAAPEPADDDTPDYMKDGEEGETETEAAPAGSVWDDAKGAENTKRAEAPSAPPIKKGK